jgi:hypothetical protein
MLQRVLRDAEERAKEAGSFSSLKLAVSNRSFEDPTRRRSSGPKRCWVPDSRCQRFLERWRRGSRIRDAGVFRGGGIEDPVSSPCGFRPSGLWLRELGHSGSTSLCLRVFGSESSGCFGFDGSRAFGCLASESSGGSGWKSRESSGSWLGESERLGLDESYARWVTAWRIRDVSGLRSLFLAFGYLVRWARPPRASRFEVSERPGVEGVGGSRIGDAGGLGSNGRREPARRVRGVEDRGAGGLRTDCARGSGRVALRAHGVEGSPGSTC